jgi:predicted Rossmann fold flavoprotein
MRVVIAGGGAAGFFSAITCAESIPDVEVLVLEKSPDLLAKVLISGGGRCNCTHSCFEPAELVKRYPRGQRELLGPFHRWQPRDTMDWFASRGVKLKTEPDGRVFPVSDQSRTIADCLQAAARHAGVRVQTRCGLAQARPRPDRTGFQLELTTGEPLEADRLLLATGGNQNSQGFALAHELGHTIEPPVPSLFTFDVRDPRLEGRAGLSVRDVAVEVPSARLRERGPMLVTHWGVSGPAILKLSAWGARVLHAADYHFDFVVNWLPAHSAAQVREVLAGGRAGHARKEVAGWSPFPELPRRLWEALVAAAGVGTNLTWAGLSKVQAGRLEQELCGGRYSSTGRSINKDEFVTCGGVRLREVNFQTMESRICRGLYFAGEVLDIDGVTGGFNFQAAWTTGWIAGKSMGQEGAG